MKILVLLTSMLAALGFGNPAPEASSNPVPEAPANSYSAEFVMTTSNCALQERFEQQFPEFVADVSAVNVHHNDVNGYYYAVYGVNEEGNSVIEYFKTTAEEVANQEYNYIEMNDNTMQNLGNRTACREPRTWPPQGQFCSRYNTGVICGVYIPNWNTCLLY